MKYSVASCMLVQSLLYIFPSQAFLPSHSSVSVRYSRYSREVMNRDIVFPLNAQPLGVNSRRKIRKKKKNTRKKSNNPVFKALNKNKNKDTPLVSITSDDKKENFNPLHRISAQQSLDRYHYLHETTKALLDTDVYPLGSFCKGKWHELKSMLIAWSKWMNSDSYKVAIKSNNDMKEFADPTYLPLFVESIMKRIIDERSAGNDDVQITVQMYNIILETWIASVSKINQHAKKRNSSNKDNGPISITAAQRSYDIVKQMQREYEETGDEGIKPNFYSFLIVLKLWTRASYLTSIPPSKKNIASHKATRKAHQTIRWMEQLATSGGNSDARPNMLTYTIVMDAYAKSGEMDAGQKAEAFMHEMDLDPNLFCYNMVINAYTRQGRREGAVDNAERILHEIENIYEKTHDESMKPDVITYTSLVTAWANSNRKGHGANRAEDILNRMMEAGCEPNTVTFNAVLKSWCKSAERDAPEKALNIFERMEDEFRRGNKEVIPDRITYNTLIHILAKSGRTNAMNNAERILALMETSAESDPSLAPNLFSYNIIIEGWGKVRDSDGAMKAYAILQRLLSLKQERSRVQPDVFSFNNVIFALSRSGMKSSALRAEELLQYMLAEYMRGNTRLKPDVFGYSATIHAWARSGNSEAGSRAEDLLNQMEEMYAAGEEKLKPNIVTFNSCIDCWAKSRQAIMGARKAEQLLARMDKMYMDGDESIKPTAHTYNSVLHAWANSNTKCAHWKSQAILTQMWRQHKNGNRDIKPDALAYNTVIHAVSKSNREDKAQKALRILRTMDKLYRAGLNNDARPNEFTYTSVLNSCALSCVGGKLAREKALHTAIFTFEELRESSYGNPNHVTYGMFLKACANLIPTDTERRRDVVEPVFIQCCKDGQVGEIVLRQLRLAAPDDLYQKLLGDLSHSGSTVRIEDLPKEWRCNVRNERHSKRKGKRSKAKYLTT